MVEFSRTTEVPYLALDALLGKTYDKTAHGNTSEQTSRQEIGLITIKPPEKVDHNCVTFATS